MPQPLQRSRSSPLVLSSPMKPITHQSSPKVPTSITPTAPGMSSPKKIISGLTSSKTLQKLAKKSPVSLLQKSQELPKPSFLKSRLLRQIDSPLKKMDNNILLKTLMNSQNEKGARFQSVYRGKEELSRSGILADLSILAERGIEVPKSEVDRSIQDDAVLVMSDLSKLTENQIETLKMKAYFHPETVRDLPISIEKGYYGSDQHKQYGALVESLTGGVISAEEAMRMNPCGGLPGPGGREIPLLNSIDFMQRHALRHDAVGFLISHFGVGPGYGTPTTPLGLDSHNPLAGQILGVLRESLVTPSVFPKSDHVGSDERFQEQILT